MDKNLRAYMAELLGTFALVFVGAAAVCTNQLALQLGRPNPGLVGIALAEGLALAAALAVTLPLSGGFLNPAITLMLWVFKRFDGGKTAGLIFVQLLGAALAGGLVRLVFYGNELTLTAAHLGTPHVYSRFEGTGFPPAAALTGVATELALTFVLTVVIFGTLIDSRAPRLLGPLGRWLAPLWAGLALAALILAGFSLTGAATNPARWFGTVLWETTVPALQARRPFTDHMVYWIGPILGALLAGGAYITILPPEELEARPPAPPEPAATGKAAGPGTLFRSRK